MRPAAPGRVHPTREDPVVAALSPVVGGPMGRHGTGHPWWHPLRVVLALTAATLALGMVQQVPCVAGSWTSPHAQHARLCASSVADSYVAAGLTELVWPFTDDPAVRARHEAPDLPVLTAVWAWGAAHVTHGLTGSPDVAARAQQPVDDVAATDAVRREVRVFVAVNAVGMAVLALLAAWCLVRAAGPRRPWDAAVFAASPLLALTWLTDWMLLPNAALAVALALWTSRRRAWAVLAVTLGLGAWVPTGDLADPGLGSVWLLVAQAADTAYSSSTVLLGAGAVLLAWCAATWWLARRTGAHAAQAALLVLVGVLLVSPQAPPSWSLLLLPVAALAVPRWRDLLVWQAGELVALLLTGLYVGGYLAPTGGGDAPAYWLAIVVRVLAQLWLAGVVVVDLVSRSGPRRTAWR